MPPRKSKKRAASEVGPESKRRKEAVEDVVVSTGHNVGAIFEARVELCNLDYVKVRALAWSDEQKKNAHALFASIIVLFVDVDSTAPEIMRLMHQACVELSSLLNGEQKNTQYPGVIKTMTEVKSELTKLTSRAEQTSETKWTKLKIAAGTASAIMVASMGVSLLAMLAQLGQSQEAFMAVFCLMVGKYGFPLSLNYVLDRVLEQVDRVRHKYYRLPADSAGWRLTRLIAVALFTNLLTFWWAKFCGAATGAFSGITTASLYPEELADDIQGLGNSADKTLAAFIESIADTKAFMNMAFAFSSRVSSVSHAFVTNLVPSGLNTAMGLLPPGVKTFVGSDFMGIQPVMKSKSGKLLKILMRGYLTDSISGHLAVRSVMAGQQPVKPELATIIKSVYKTTDNFIHEVEQSDDVYSDYRELLLMMFHAHRDDEGGKK